MFSAAKLMKFLRKSALIKNQKEKYLNFKQKNKLHSDVETTIY